MFTASLPYNWESLTLNASYIAGEKKDTDGYGLSAVYVLPMGLGFGLGYSANDNGEGNGKANQLIGGVNYEMDALYLGLTYTEGDLDDDANQEFEGLEFVAQYKLTDQFRLIGAYQKQKVKDNGDKSDISDFLELTARYDFNKHIRGYLAYKLNNLDKEEIGETYDAKDTVRLGLRYDF